MMQAPGREADLTWDGGVSWTSGHRHRAPAILRAARAAPV